MTRDELLAWAKAGPRIATRPETNSSVAPADEPEKPAGARSNRCPMCDVLMEPENAHDRCPRCGFKTHCCEGGPG